MTPCLEIRNLSIDFLSYKGKKNAVNNLSLSVPTGKTVCIVGESGSGKSVTALSILDLLSKEHTEKKGEIIFQGQDLHKISKQNLRSIRGNEISIIFQEPMTSLNPLHNIEKQIAESLYIHKNIKAKKARPQILKLLERVGIPNAEQRLNALPHELSGGQRQRVMIAIALANEPKLLIADEPTTALDVTVQKQILNLLKDLQKETNMTILLISHDLSVINYMADEVYVMKGGKIIEHQKTSDLFQSPKKPYTKALLDANISDTLSPLPTQQPILLRAKNINVKFPIKKGLLKRNHVFLHAVNNISLQIYANETLGIVGESGSGKTTIGRALLRLQDCQGEIYFDKQNIHNLKSKSLRTLRQEMQIVFQDPYGALSPRMSVKQIIAEGLTIHQPHLTTEDISNLVSQAVEDVGLPKDCLHRYPHEFSGGQRQRISIARSLILNPRLIVLDEPTSALDRSVQIQILTLLRKLQQTKKIAYLFISHDLNVVRSMAHRVMVMQNGYVVETGLCENIFNNPQQDYTKKLLKAAFT